MIVTNKFNVPDVIFRAAKNDKYSRGKADVSVTQLIDAPQISVLREKHVHSLQQDVTDRIWSLLGTAVHGLLENAAEGVLVEERLFTDVGGLTLSGAIDVQEFTDDGINIMDFKVCSTSAIEWPKKSWEHQLNCYAYLIRKAKGLHVSRLQICAILRDWKKSETRRSNSYPESPILTIEIPLWTELEQDTYVEERAALHKLARDGGYVPCSKEERWERGEKWAVRKPGLKRASRTFSNEEEAIAMAATGEYIVEHRPGSCTRCEQDYCGVARWCEQWRKIKDGGSTETTDDWL